MVPYVSFQFTAHTALWRPVTYLCELALYMPPKGHFTLPLSQLLPDAERPDKSSGPRGCGAIAILPLLGSEFNYAS